MTDVKNRLKSAMRMLLGDYERRRHRVAGVLGNGDGSTISVTNRPGYVWVRLPNRELLQVLNVSNIPAEYDSPVHVGYTDINPETLQILGPNLASTGIDKDEVIYPFVQNHGHTHEWEAANGGYDPVQMHLRAFTPLRVTFTGGLTAHVHRGFIPLASGGVAWVDHQDIDLTSSVPSNLHRWVIVYADRITGTVLTQNGDIARSPSLATIPSPPVGGNLLAAVLLSAGQTELSENASNTSLVDLRFMIQHDHDERYSTDPVGAVAWKISLFRDGELIDAYDADATGLQAAIDDAQANDTIYITPATYSADFAIPADVALVGLSRNDVIIDGVVSLADGASLQNLSVIVEDTTSDTQIAVDVAASATCSAIDVVIASYQHGTGDSIAINVGAAGSMQVRNSYIRATADSGGDPYGSYVGAGGSAGARFCYIQASYICNDNSLFSSYANQYPSGASNIGTLADGDRAKVDHTHSAVTGVHQAIITFTGTLSTVDNPLRIPNVTGGALTISKVYLIVGTAPTGAAIICDVHLDGTTIFTTQANRPQIADGNNSGNSTSMDVTSWPDGSYLTGHIDQVGSTTPGANLTMVIVYS